MRVFHLLTFVAILAAAVFAVSTLAHKEPMPSAMLAPEVVHAPPTTKAAAMDDLRDADARRAVPTGSDPRAPLAIVAPPARARTWADVPGEMLDELDEVGAQQVAHELRGVLLALDGVPWTDDQWVQLCAIASAETFDRHGDLLARAVAIVGPRTVQAALRRERLCALKVDCTDLAAMLVISEAEALALCSD